MGFNFGAALGGATQSFQSTLKDMREEQRRQKEQAYIDEQRKRETDYNEGLKAIPTIGAEYDPQSLPQDLRPVETMEDKLSAKRGTNVSLVQAPQPPAFDSSLEGAPEAAIPVPNKRKATQAEVLAMQAAVARRVGYGDKALQFGSMANTEALRGTQALILREAATRGWQGLDDVVEMVADGHKLERRTNKDGVTEVSYGGDQWVPAGSPMEAATLLTASMAGDPDKYIQYFNMADSRRLAAEAAKAQKSHWDMMADLQRQENEIRERVGMAEIAARRAASGAEANAANARLAAFQQQQNMLGEFNKLMADPYGNAQALEGLAGQLAIVDPNYLGQTTNADGTTVYENKLLGFVRKAGTDRETALKGNPMFADGRIFRDPVYGGWRVKGLSEGRNALHFDNFESALAAANDFYGKQAASTGTPVQKAPQQALPVDRRRPSSNFDTLREGFGTLFGK